MSFKLIGGAIILLIAAFVADELCKRESQKERQIKAVTALLKFFRSQIDLYSAPIGEIFLRADRELLFDCTCRSLPSDFESFLAALEKKPDPRALSVLASFSAELGSSYKEEQIKSCDYHIAQMSEIAADVTVEVRKNKRLCITLCLSAAALTVILLI